MCGRYTLFEDTGDQKLIDILNQINSKHPMEPVKTGEIFPSNPVPVLMEAANHMLEAERMLWGFPNFRNKGVIINARAETATDKTMFRKNLQTHRCVIPSTGFYEWSHEKEKTKYRFNLPESDTLYMAGIYNIFGKENRFVILTTAANESMAGIHNRMPVILSEDEIEKWILNEEETPAILVRTPEQLMKTEV